jgi:hypothetical protein
MMLIPAMGKDDLLQNLRDLETSLGSEEVEDLVVQQDQATRQRFVALREQVTVVVGKLENAQLADIADQLDRLSPQLNDGIVSLKHELSSIDNAIAIINTASTVISLAASVAAVV